MRALLCLPFLFAACGTTTTPSEDEDLSVETPDASVTTARDLKKPADRAGAKEDLAAECFSGVECPSGSCTNGHCDPVGDEDLAVPPGDMATTGKPDLVAAKPDLAASKADMTVTTTTRPWTGATAKMRYMDFQLLTKAAASTFCIWGDDGDPRPYAVLADVSHAVSEKTYTVSAKYVDVPAGIPLRSSASFTLAPAKPVPAECDLKAATPMYGGKSLTASRYYSSWYTHVDDFFVRCSTGTMLPDCAFYPQASSSVKGTCPTGKWYTREDGENWGTGYVGGFRVLNLTQNTATLAATTTPFNFKQITNLFLGDNPPNVGYFIPASSTSLRICPRYLDACYDDKSTPPFDDVKANVALTDCSMGVAQWTVGAIDSPRLKSTNQATTFYVLGEAKRLASDSKSLLGDDVMIVVANDVTDGTF